jgi:2,4-dienoyl-CoA reductase-like NADH-dependent reductase (Old Yellow Enzyme family)
MNHPILFTTIQVGNLELVNRIVIAPMQQYSTEDGQLTDCHLVHLVQMASSGAAALTIEGQRLATKVALSTVTADCIRMSPKLPWLEGCAAFDGGRTYQLFVDP